jgi:hypothetical protein
MTGRWPLSGLASMRAKTLAALADAASKPSLPRPHAELASFWEIFSPGASGSLAPCASQTDGPSYGVKLGARAASNASTGRTLPLRAQRECQATSESITDAQSASKDGRSRRGVTGASPQKPSAALPNYCSYTALSYLGKAGRPDTDEQSKVSDGRCLSKHHRTSPCRRPVDRAPSCKRLERTSRLRRM